MSLKQSVRLGKVLLSSIVMGLVVFTSLALVACTAGMPVTEVITPTPRPDNPASLTPTASPFASSTPVPSVLPSPTTPPPQPTPTPKAEFDIAQLSPWLVIEKLNGLTATLILGVANNNMEMSAPKTYYYVYDGDPQTGGELIAQTVFTTVKAAEGGGPGVALQEATWDIRGKGGTRELHFFLCLADLPRSSDTCVTWHRPEEIPQLVWGVEVLDGAEVLLFDVVKREHVFERGEQVPIRIYAANLDPTETFSFAMKSWVDFRSSPPVTYTLGERRLQLPPGQMFEHVYHYDTSLMPGPSGEAFLQLAGIETQIPQLSGYGAQTKTDDFTLPLDAYFIADPLTGTVPLTVTFVNLTTSLDGKPVESWWWSFGDGLTSTAQLPTHTYTLPGAYTVVLTATVYGENLPGMRELLSTVGNTPADLYTRYYTFTYTRPDYILVRP